MENDKKLSKALQDFKKKYQSITSADLQAFILGWQEAVKNFSMLDAYIIELSDEELRIVTKDELDKMYDDAMQFDGFLGYTVKGRLV